MTHMPPRITLTADDVRELLRQFQGWEMVHNMVDGWESWSWRGSTCSVWFPSIPNWPTKADHQPRLWDAVRDPPPFDTIMYWAEKDNDLFSLFIYRGKWRL